MASFQKVFLEITVIYSIFLMVVGFFGNVFCLIICLRKKMRSIPTFVFYTFLVVSDTIALYQWNMDHPSLFYSGYFLEDLSLHLCRAMTFFQIFSLQWSSWLLTAMNVEMLMSTIWLQTWRAVYFKPKRAILFSSLIGGVLFAINITFTLKIDRTQASDPTYNITCFALPIYGVWMEAQNYLFCFMPFTIMLFSNILIIYRISTKKKQMVTHAGRDSKHETQKTAVTVLTVTLVFLLTSAPSAIINAFFLNEVLSNTYGLAILFTTSNIAFTSNSFNFLILYLSNKQFAREARNLFLIVRKFNKVDPNDLSGTTRAIKGISRHTNTNHHTNH